MIHKFVVNLTTSTLTVFVVMVDPFTVIQEQHWDDYLFYIYKTGFCCWATWDPFCKFRIQEDATWFVYLPALPLVKVPPSNLCRKVLGMAASNWQNVANIFHMCHETSLANKYWQEPKLRTKPAWPSRWDILDWLWSLWESILTCKCILRVIFCLISVGELSELHNTNECATT